MNNDIKKLAHELALSKKHVLMYLREGGHVEIIDENNVKVFRGKPVGLALSYLEDGKIYLGWSKCNTTEDDFNRYKGILTAFSKKRAKPLGEEVKDDFGNVPHDMLPLLNKVIDVTKKKVEAGLWNLQ